MGSCDNRVTEKDLIVALNAPQYDFNGQGLKWCRSHACIEIEDIITGIKTRASISDRCASCAYGQLDLTWAVMHSLGRFRDGNFQIRWRFCND